MKKRWVRRLATFPVILCCLLSFPSFVTAGKDNLPRFPGQALLIGRLPEDLAITVGDDTTQIQGGGEWELIPSISADGRIVASASLVPNLPLESEPRFVVATYSMASHRWIYYQGLEIKGGSIAISPDGSKLACSHMSSGPSLIHILDLKTGKLWIGPQTTKGSFLTWSPDSRRIAFNKELGQDADDAPVTLLPEIDILNLDTGKVSKLADGIAPSWSPSGEWIAFSDYSAFQHGRYADTTFRVSLIHPDGTGSKVVAQLKPGQDLYVPALWSPDSKEFLLQRPQEDEVHPRMNIELLNLATLNRTTRFRKTPQVYGWVTSR